MTAAGTVVEAGAGTCRSVPVGSVLRSPTPRLAHYDADSLVLTFVSLERWKALDVTVVTGEYWRVSPRHLQSSFCISSRLWPMKVQHAYPGSAWWCWYLPVSSRFGSSKDFTQWYLSRRLDGCRPVVSWNCSEGQGGSIKVPLKRLRVGVSQRIAVERLACPHSSSSSCTRQGVRETYDLRNCERPSTYVS